MWESESPQLISNYIRYQLDAYSDIQMCSDIDVLGQGTAGKALISCEKDDHENSRKYEKYFCLKNPINILI